MQTVESILDQFRNLSEEDQRRLVREITRTRLLATARRIADGREPMPPVGDEELNQLVHEARREVLRARGL